MNTAKIKELEALREKTAQLEAALQQERAKELAELPAKYGFASAEEFIAALYAAAGKRRGRRRRASAAKPTGRKPRVKITDEVRAAVKQQVAAGKTGAEIAKSLGISLPSVQNIKKDLGLVKRRK